MMSKNLARPPLVPVDVLAAAAAAAADFVPPPPAEDVQHRREHDQVRGAPRVRPAVVQLQHAHEVVVARPPNEETSKPNASTIRELEKSA
jgi:hypothetical protein